MTGWQTTLHGQQLQPEVLFVRGSMQCSASLPAADSMFAADSHVNAAWCFALTAGSAKSAAEHWLQLHGLCGTCVNSPFFSWSMVVELPLQLSLPFLAPPDCENGSVSSVCGCQHAPLFGGVVVA